MGALIRPTFRLLIRAARGCLRHKSAAQGHGVEQLERRITRRAGVGLGGPLEYLFDKLDSRLAGPPSPVGRLADSAIRSAGPRPNRPDRRHSGRPAGSALGSGGRLVTEALPSCDEGERFDRGTAHQRVGRSRLAGPGRARVFCKRTAQDDCRSGTRATSAAFRSWVGATRRSRCLIIFFLRP